MSMYLDHFGLSEAPFRITPHTGFFFDGANRGATLEALLYAVTNDEGIVKVTGEVGSGKTMLCRMLLEKLPEKVETIYLANPSLSRDELIHALAEELKIPAPPRRLHLLLRALQQRLVDLYAAGKQVVVLIDEAHAMPTESLEEIRLLSNLESNRHKLLQIVLFGQSELDSILSEQHMRQLRERVTHSFQLEPLHRTDVNTYLMFRLRAAGYHGPDLFTANAIKLFAKASEGLTRRLNVLADKALLAAFASNRHQIDSKEAKAAIRDARFEDLKKPKPSKNRMLWTGLATGTAATLAVVGLTQLLNKPPPAATDTAAHTAAASPPSAVAPPPSLPAEPAAPALPASTASLPVAPSAAVADPAAPQVGTQAASSTIAPPVVMAAAPAAAPPTPSPSMQNKSAAKAGTSAATPASQGMNTAREPAAARKSPLIEEHALSFRKWIANASDQRFVIQLASATSNNRSQIELFLRNAREVIPPRDLRVYAATSQGQQWLGIVYGDFAGLSDAEKSLAELPPQLRSHQAFIRPIKQLRPQ